MHRTGEFSEGNRFVHAQNIAAKADKPEPGHGPEHGHNATHLSERITKAWHTLQHVGHVALHPDVNHQALPESRMADVSPLPPDAVASSPEVALPLPPVVFEQAA